MADCNAALQEEATDSIDHGLLLPDQARSHTVQALAGPTDRQSLLERSVSMAAALLPNCVCVPEVVLVTLTERLGICRRYLFLHHDRARTACGQHSASPYPPRSRSSKAMHSLAARRLPWQASHVYNCSRRSRPIKCNVFLPVSMPIVLDSDSVCLLQHGSMLLGAF